MTRNDLVVYAFSVLTELADECGVALSDSADGLRFQIDAAWAALGDDTSNTDAAQALVEYHCLRRFRLAVSVRTDNGLTDIRRKRSQIFEQIDRLVEDAANRAAAAGHPIQPASPMANIDWNTDWIEAEESTV